MKNHIKNKHLTMFDRSLIQLRLKDGWTIYRISKEIGCAYNTVSNEIKRGTVFLYKNLRHCYRAKEGQEIYLQNRKNSHRTGKFSSCQDFVSQIEINFSDPLKLWSIDASIGKLELLKRFSKTNSVCTKTLYNWIHKQKLKISISDLPECLKRKKSKIRNTKNKMNLGTSIEFRPAEIANRNSFGHWEIDTVIGKKSGKNKVILTIAERLTDFYITRIIESKTAFAVNSEIKKLQKEFGNSFSKVFKTITSDNGLEFALLSELEKKSDTKIYFAHPYSSFERGINERHNRILRKFVPKSFDINKLKPEDLEHFENLINGLPRKRLNYRTPEELFNEQLDIIYKRE